MRSRVRNAWRAAGAVTVAGLVLAASGWVLAQTAPKAGELRTWTDKSGKFQTQAKLLAVVDGKVRLEKANGSVIEVPLERLSDADREHLARAAAPEKKPEAPQPVAPEKKPETPQPPAPEAKPETPQPVAPEGQPQLPEIVDDEIPEITWPKVKEKPFTVGDGQVADCRALVAELAAPKPDTFERLEKALADCRARRVHLKDTGDAELEAWYATLATSGNRLLGGADGNWTKHIAALEAWLAANPKSVGARVALAHAYKCWAWQARGAGFAGTVSRDGFKLFGERLEKGVKHLMDAAKLPDADAAVFAEFIDCAKGLGGERKHAYALLMSAIERDPTYFPAYVAFAEFMLPRWHGLPGENAAVARSLAEQLDGNLGNMAAAVIVRRVMRYEKHSMELWYYRYPIERLYRGGRRLAEQAPNSLGWSTFAAYFAWLSDDVPFALQELKRNNSQYALEMFTEETLEQFSLAVNFRPFPTALGSFQAMLGSVIDAHLSEDGSRLIVIHGTLRRLAISIWKLPKGECEAILPLPEHTARARFSADGRYIAVSLPPGENDRGAWTHLLVRGESITQEKPEFFVLETQDQIYFADVSRDRRRAAVAFQHTGDVELWSLESKTRLWNKPVKKQTRSECIISQDGSTVFVSAGGGLFALQAKDGAIVAKNGANTDPKIKTLAGATGDVYLHSCDPEGRLFAFALAPGEMQDQRRLSLLRFTPDAKEVQTLATFPFPVHDEFNLPTMSFTSDFKLAFILRASTAEEAKRLDAESKGLVGEQMLDRYDLATGERTRSNSMLKKLPLCNVLFTPDGKEELTIGSFGLITRWPFPNKPAAPPGEAQETPPKP